MLEKKLMFRVANLIDFLLVLICILVCLSWFFGSGLGYSESAPVLSPFTAFSLLLMAGSRLMSRLVVTWGYPMTLALLGIVACGNLSSLWIELTMPQLFLQTFPTLVPTSALTSVGIILLCAYSIIVTLRKTPHSVFILDDLLLLLALFPGGLSLMGHLLGVHAYMGKSMDPRVGVSILEMFLMGGYVVVATLTNKDLFLWRFLRENHFNKVIFSAFFLNQYIIPFAVGYGFRPAKLSTYQFGLEFYVMVAGVMATVVFLLVQAFIRKPKK